VKILDGVEIVVDMKGQGLKVESDMANYKPEVSMNELESKINEYDGEPAHLLGLDGWLLRVLPAGSHKAFLLGYEKLLRTTFHPDRFQDPAQKVKYEKYLQRISEAVSLLSDDFVFAMEIDSVPTQRSLVVRLRLELEEKEKTIERLHEEKQQEQRLRIEAEKKQEELQKKLGRLSKNL
jgi:hypothetical protein